MISFRRQSRRHHRQKASIFAGVQAALRTPRALVTLVIGLMLAGAAFAHATAQNGIALTAFRPLGTNFYAWRTEQRVRDVTYIRREGQIAGARFVREGRAVLAGQPLAPRALRTVGWGFAAQGDTARARAAMLGSDRISRRDPLTQDWLFRDNAQRGDVAATLDMLNILLRTEPALRNDLLVRMAGVLPLPAARAAIRPLITADNPWLEDLISVASIRSPRVAPLAQLVIEQRRMPDSPQLRQSYARMVDRLVTEREFALLARVYPLLPGADRSTTASLSLTPVQFDGGYAPLTWGLAAESDWGAARVPVSGAPTQTALEFFAQPTTRGVTASKLLLLGAGPPQQMRWRVLERSEAPGAEAYWQLTCLDSADAPRITRTVNLFGLPTTRGGTLDLPAGCRIVRVDMVVAGGNGRDHATLLVGDISLSTTARGAVGVGAPRTATGVGAARVAADVGAPRAGSDRPN